MALIRSVCGNAVGGGDPRENGHPQEEEEEKPLELNQRVAPSSHHYLASDFMPHMRRCRCFTIAAMLVKLTLKGGQIVARS